jgi:hypothetical protein
MEKRRRDNTMEKRRTDNTMEKRRRRDNTIEKRKKDKRANNDQQRKQVDVAPIPVWPQSFRPCVSPAPNNIVVSAPI